MATRSITEVDRIFPETRYYIHQALRAALDSAAFIRIKDPKVAQECEAITAKLNDIARRLGIEL